jgi:hypothetical protein
VLSYVAWRAGIAYSAELAQLSKVRLKLPLQEPLRRAECHPERKESGDVGECTVQVAISAQNGWAGGGSFVFDEFTVLTG